MAERRTPGGEAALTRAQAPTEPTPRARTPNPLERALHAHTSDEPRGLDVRRRRSAEHVTTGVLRRRSLFKRGRRLFDVVADLHVLLESEQIKNPTDAGVDAYDCEIAARAPDSSQVA